MIHSSQVGRLGLIHVYNLHFIDLAQLSCFTHWWGSEVCLMQPNISFSHSLYIIHDQGSAVIHSAVIIQVDSVIGHRVDMPIFKTSLNAILLNLKKMGSGSDPTTFTKAASPWLAEQIYHPHHLYNFEPVSGATTWEKQVQKRETNNNSSNCLIWLSDFYSPLLAIQFSFAVPQFLPFVRKALKIECCDLLFNVSMN